METGICQSREKQTAWQSSTAKLLLDWLLVIAHIYLTVFLFPQEHAEIAADSCDPGQWEQRNGGETATAERAHE